MSFFKRQDNTPLIEMMGRIGADLEILKTKVNMLESDVSNLRGRINRKLGESKETKKDISESVLLTPDGNFI